MSNELQYLGRTSRARTTAVPIEATSRQSSESIPPSLCHLRSFASGYHHSLQPYVCQKSRSVPRISIPKGDPTLTLLPPVSRVRESNSGEIRRSVWEKQASKGPNTSPLHYRTTVQRSSHIVAPCQVLHGSAA